MVPVCLSWLRSLSTVEVARKSMPALPRDSKHRDGYVVLPLSRVALYCPCLLHSDRLLTVLEVYVSDSLQPHRLPCRRAGFFAAITCIAKPILSISAGFAMQRLKSGGLLCRARQFFADALIALQYDSGMQEALKRHPYLLIFVLCAAAPLLVGAVLGPRWSPWGCVLSAPIFFTVQIWCAPRRFCDSCGYRLPKLRMPRTAHQLNHGGWTCPKCGQEVNHLGRKEAIA